MYKEHKSQSLKKEYSRTRLYQVHTYNEQNLLDYLVPKWLLYFTNLHGYSNVTVITNKY